VSTVLQAQDVSVRAGLRFLLREVSLSVAAGERVALVGPNGAGKSTLIRVQSGELRPHAGAVRLKDREIGSYSPRMLALHRAVLSQNISVTFPFTVAEMVRMGAGDRSGAAIDALVDKALYEIDLSDFRDRVITTLSGGEQGRAHFARVLVQLACGEGAYGPGVLLLDEPTAALDLRHQLDMAASAKRCAERGTAVIAILHDLNLAAWFAERVIVLDRGEIVADGAPAETITDAMLHKVFGIAVEVGQAPPPGTPFVLPHGARPAAR
jgi:iron complex transport system ATP-binding protein